MCTVVGGKEGYGPQYPWVYRNKLNETRISEEIEIAYQRIRKLSREIEGI